MTNLRTVGGIVKWKFLDSKLKQTSMKKITGNYFSIKQSTGVIEILDTLNLVKHVLFLPDYLFDVLVFLINPQQNSATWKILGSIVYNRAIVYKHQNFLKVVVHVIIIDQCNQTAR